MSTAAHVNMLCSRGTSFGAVISREKNLLTSGLKICEQLQTTVNSVTKKAAYYEIKLCLGVRDDRTKERMLRDADLTLQKALDACRAAESTKVQMREMTSTAVEDKLINEVKHVSAKSNNEATRGTGSCEVTNIIPTTFRALTATSMDIILASARMATASRNLEDRVDVAIHVAIVVAAGVVVDVVATTTTSTKCKKEQRVCRQICIRTRISFKAYR